MDAATRAKTSQCHVVTLNYTDEILTPVPDRLPVRVSDSIVFQQGTAPAGQILRITFDHPEFFSAPGYSEGDAPIVVTASIPRGAGTYRCGLAPYGAVVDQSSLRPGGVIEIETSTTVSR